MKIKTHHSGKSGASCPLPRIPGARQRNGYKYRLLSEPAARTGSNKAPNHENSTSSTYIPTSGDFIFPQNAPNPSKDRFYTSSEEESHPVEKPPAAASYPTSRFQNPDSNRKRNRPAPAGKEPHKKAGTCGTIHNRCKLNGRNMQALFQKGREQICKTCGTKPYPMQAYRKCTISPAKAVGSNSIIYRTRS